MAIMNLNPHAQIVSEAKYLLRKFRFGFEKSEVVLEYFGLEDTYRIGAIGVYRIQFELGNSLNLKENTWTKIGLIPIWADPIC